VQTQKSNFKIAFWIIGEVLEKRVKDVIIIGYAYLFSHFRLSWFTWPFIGVTAELRPLPLLVTGCSLAFSHFFSGACSIVRGR
jgi:hypothetical protein